VAKAIDKASGYEGEVIGTRIVDVGIQGGNMHAGRKQQQRQQIHALSPEAAAWQGWGTCLKPAYEPIIVARKPLDGTIAANVLKHGTGALNIDACRVPTEDVIATKGNRDSAKVYDRYNGMAPQQSEGQKLGRFPANIIHDGSEEVLALFPDSKGQCGAVKGTEPSRTGSNGIYGNYNGRNAMRPRGDTGSAARFFYCAKASKKDRGEGNDHPTVKPNALMRWLVRLVCPQGGTVLDPFMGSGTTGVAAVNLGNRFVGIEKESEYANIATARIDEAVNEKKQMLDI
jgi:site-specific DNA-methyltransferase (adenine-specific)